MYLNSQLLIYCVNADSWGIIQFASYLWVRSQVVDFITVDGSGCQRRQVMNSKGVLQGSILGPVLFLIFLNNLPCNVQSAIICQFVNRTILQYDMNFETIECSTKIYNSLWKVIYWRVVSRCVICMVELLVGDSVRYLPCMHTYHVKCIDDWLMRSFTCPSCMEPVDAALLTTYETR